MNFKNRDLITLNDYTTEEIKSILEKAKKVEKYEKTREKKNILQGFVLATLFFEPSTEQDLVLNPQCKSLEVT